jgi:hypothetical protein
MGFFDWAALIVGTGLIAGGVRAIGRGRVSAPERDQGEGAVRLGWVWIGLGALFVLAAILDTAFLKTVFHLFLEAAN